MIVFFVCKGMKKNMSILSGKWKNLIDSAEYRHFFLFFEKSFRSDYRLKFNRKGKVFFYFYFEKSQKCP